MDHQANKKRGWRIAFSLLFAFVAIASPMGYAADPPAAEDEAQEMEGEDVENLKLKPNRIVIVEPKKELDPEIASEEVLKYLESAKANWDGGDFEFAEKYFAAALGVPAEVPEKETVLSTMGYLYHREGMFPKAAAVLERLAQEFPDSRKLPEVYMDLGNLYRKMGAIELAISKYYMVMNSSLNVEMDQLKKYKILVLKAKLEIAESHAERHEFQESYRKYENLFRLDLKPVERLRVHYRMCYLLYELGNFQQAVSQLKLFLEEYPESPHSPEIRYLLAKSYERLNRKPEALREVIEILQQQASPETMEDNGDYWRQRMGNELANEFYQKGDFRSALTIYQSLVRYSEDPAWQWPAIHQIGLCFERLGLPEKAILAYKEITAVKDEATADENLPGNLLPLRRMAQWRLEHLQWEDDLLSRLNILRTQ